MLSAQHQPVLFVGHGSPLNAIEDNIWSRGFRALADKLPRPRAVLTVSAHWFVDRTGVTGNQQPKTIHDFGGFPTELYAINYPAPGAPQLARQIVDLLAAHQAALDDTWGLDHGTWTVLRHIFPAADIPVLQLSINAQLPVAAHIEIGRALAPLRDENILIFASGNIVHNLRDAFMRSQRGDLTTPDWARAFDQKIADALSGHDHQTFIHALDGKIGAQAHPSPDHYLPLLYAAGASTEQDSVSFPITGFDMGSLSMRAVLFE
jgi:4,5-DOPA dioxygenase extradiol